MVSSIDTSNLNWVPFAFMLLSVRCVDSNSRSSAFHVTPNVRPTSMQHQLRESGMLWL